MAQGQDTVVWTPLIPPDLNVVYAPADDFVLATNSPVVWTPLITLPGSNVVYEPVDNFIVITNIPPVIPPIIPPDTVVVYEPGNDFIIITNWMPGGIILTQLVARTVVNLAAVETVAAESGTNSQPKKGVFVITRSGPTNIALRVYYTVKGTASNGVDYVRLDGDRTISAGSTRAEIAVTPIKDQKQEEVETVVMTLQEPVCAAIYPPPPECYILGENKEAVVRIYDAWPANNRAPSVQFQTPTNGATFVAHTNILLWANASDPDGTIKSVEFYRGSTRIGYGTNYSFDSGPFYRMTWSNVTAGSYVLTARATDNAGLSKTSAPVEIKVVAPAKSQITILSPTNNTQFTAPARVVIEATSIDPKGYISTVEFYSGSTRIGQSVLAFDRPPESGAILQHRFVWTNAAAGSYTLTARGKDKSGATITSEPVKINVNPAPKATLVINSPTNGAVYVAPAKIEIRATAIDPKGYISTVDFYAGTSKIGQSRIFFIRAPNPGEPVYHTFIWTNVPAGHYELRAKAIDTAGNTIVSETVKVEVAAAAAKSFVERSLPESYTPGSAFIVRLFATPGQGVSVYAVEEQPPQGWTVKAISHEGIYDALTGKVKFGPYFDHTARTLSYEVTPPATASGTNQFSGTASADGVNSTVAGRNSVARAARHPADLEPGNFVMTLNEVTAYGMAWRKNKTWSVAPNPIPANYVTRAGALWKGGERYHFDAKAGSPPLCWVNDPGTNLVRMGVQDIAAGAPGVALPEMPASGKAGETLTIRLHIIPAASVRAYAVEEQAPAGWLVSNPSHDGELDAASNQLKWGPFLDAAPRTLTFQATPVAITANEASFTGFASFDGVDIPVANPRQVALIGAAKAKIIQIKPLANGAWEVHCLGEIGRTYLVESSEDLVHWIVVSRVVNSEGSWRFTDNTTDGTQEKFYRVRQAPDNE